MPRYTKPSITGTSQNKPIVVPKAACEFKPYKPIAVAMAISKWLEEPMITEITASLYFKLKTFVIRIFKPTTMKKPINKGMETSFPTP
ncbi:MAG: hypothetical protein ACI86C_002010, partial [Candidatus Latescibacterota bacterium]